LTPDERGRSGNGVELSAVTAELKELARVIADWAVPAPSATIYV
jgi:hypothetical protein